jgi:hypothetical protein
VEYQVVKCKDHVCILHASVTRAGVTGVGGEVRGTRALPGVASVVVVQILAVMVLSQGPSTRCIAPWYVSNVSIIFDALCLFLHHLLNVLLHFVAFLCIFQN